METMLGIQLFIRDKQSIRLENNTAQDIKKMLMNGELDVIFTVWYDVEGLETVPYHHKYLGECPLEVCMRNTNPLAKKETLTIADLRSSDFIAISPLQTPSYTQMLKNLCAPYGFTPNFTCYTSSAHSLTINLISDNDVFICDKFFRDYQTEHLCYKPLENTKSGFALCWRKDNHKPESGLFIKETLKYLENNPFPIGIG